MWARILFHIQRFPKPWGNATPMGFTLAEDNRLYAIMPDAKLYALEVPAGLDTNAPWPMFKRDVRYSGAVRPAPGKN